MDQRETIGEADQPHGECGAPARDRQQPRNGVDPVLPLRIMVVVHGGLRPQPQLLHHLRRAFRIAARPSHGLVLQILEQEGVLQRIAQNATAAPHAGRELDPGHALQSWQQLEASQVDQGDRHGPERWRRYACQKDFEEIEDEVGDLLQQVGFVCDGRHWSSSCGGRFRRDDELEMTSICPLYIPAVSLVVVMIVVLVVVR
mmetsp:Transcript_3961/g.10476  ORF Transcript_3961/g.10476 Transcript_3961/m.10476 type:complete len:201 (+) Transcript_3961:665-1267(+)